MTSPIFLKKAQGQKHPGDGLQNQVYLVSETLNLYFKWDRHGQKYVSNNK